MLAAILSECARHIRRVTRTFIQSIKLWWGGAWWRKLFDMAVALGIAYYVPQMAIALAAANFMDGSNTLYATASMTVAFMGLEFLALWVMEAIAILCGLQISTITRRIGVNYRKRLATA